MRRFPGSGAARWRGRAMLAVGKTGGHHMRRCTGLLAGIFLLFIAGLAVAQTDGAQAEERGPFADLPWEFGPTTGKPGERATIHVPDGYAFLGSDGAARLTEIAENPPPGPDASNFPPAGLPRVTF